MTTLKLSEVRVDVEYALRYALEKKCSVCSLKWSVYAIPNDKWNLNASRWGIILGLFLGKFMSIDPAYRKLDIRDDVKTTLKQTVEDTIDLFAQKTVDAQWGAGET